MDKVERLVAALRGGEMERGEFLLRAGVLGVSVPALVDMLRIGTASAAGANQQPAAASGGTVTVAYAPEPDTLNVYSTHLLGDVEAAVVEGLLIPNGKMQYVPVLAQRVPTLQNGDIKLISGGQKMDITYHLRPGVKWSDGQPLTSADVLFTWQALGNPKFLAESKEGVDDVESISTPDALTAVVHYKRVNADFANTLFTFGLFPKHALQGKDLNTYQGYNRKPLGTGPFMVQEWSSAQYITLVRNPHYWRPGQPYLDKLIFKIVPDSNTQVQQLQTGEANFVQNVPYAKVSQVKSMSGIEVVAGKLNSWLNLNFNFKVPGLNDLAVRQAFAYGIDKKAICEQALFGLPSPIKGVIQPVSPYYNPNVPDYAYSPAKAKTLLDAAGWRLGSDGVRAKNGVRLAFNFTTYSDNADYVRVQQIIMAEMQQVGISLTAQNGPASTVSGKMYQGEYQINLHRWILAAGPSITMLFASDQIPPTGLNESYYRNPALDKLLHQSDTVLDFAKRKALLDQAQVIIAHDLPTIVIYNGTQVIAYTNKLTGFTPNPTNMTNFWNTGTWKLS
jgi:peptide/nickel transport system substrate-binding protein